jgi:hypothetical protein
MALPTLDATFASSADLSRRQMLAKWLVNLQYSGSIEDYYTLPEKYLYAKIAVAAGASRSEADYISLPDRYVWSDIYKAVSGLSSDTIDRGEKEALGWIAAAVRGDTADLAKVATYISWPWRYQVASIITSLAVDADAQSFVTTSGATDIEGIDQFVKGVKNLGLYNSMVCWPLRSTQNAGTGTTAYSLGGLGTYNGTLTNGPTWGADGVNMQVATNRRITTTLSLNQPITVFSVYKKNITTSYSVNSSSSGLVRLGQIQGSTIQAFAGNAVVVKNDINLDEFNTFQIEYNGVTSSYSNNGNLKTTANIGTNNMSDFLIGATSALNRGPLVAFMGVFASSSTALIHDVYRDHLGTGLGLP